MYWTDNSVSLERVMEMKRFQVTAPMERQELPRKEGEMGAVNGTVPTPAPGPPSLRWFRTFTSLYCRCASGTVPSAALRQLVV